MEAMMATPTRILQVFYGVFLGGCCLLGWTDDRCPFVPMSVRPNVGRERVGVSEDMEIWGAWERDGKQEHKSSPLRLISEGTFESVSTFVVEHAAAWHEGLPLETILKLASRIEG